MGFAWNFIGRAQNFCLAPSLSRRRPGAKLNNSKWLRNSHASKYTCKLKTSNSNHFKNFNAIN